MFHLIRMHGRLDAHLLSARRKKSRKIPSYDEKKELKHWEILGEPHQNARHLLAVDQAYANMHQFWMSAYSINVELCFDK